MYIFRGEYYSQAYYFTINFIDFLNSYHTQHELHKYNNVLLCPAIYIFEIAWQIWGISPATKKVKEYLVPSNKNATATPLKRLEINKKTSRQEKAITLNPGYRDYRPYIFIYRDICLILNNLLIMIRNNDIIAFWVIVMISGLLSWFSSSQVRASVELIQRKRGWAFVSFYLYLTSCDYKYVCFSLSKLPSTATLVRRPASWQLCISMTSHVSLLQRSHHLSNRLWFNVHHHILQPKFYTLTAVGAGNPS